MEVKITLTPLGHDEQQNHRTIVISSEKPSVSVGRASRNPNKGLLAASDNAWFDYPILSRTHAKFTASRIHRQIYLQDCGSTHGTYIDKRRLEADVEFALADGEVITFGQRVTSGAVTYPAKEFRVHSKWESPSEIKDSYSTSSMRTQNKVQTISIPPPSFTNDFEHSSEPSRDGSVQVVDTYRHTFSVPSSDDEAESEDEDDDVQITSSVHGDEEELSAATTPDRQAVASSYNKTEGHAQGSDCRVGSGEIRGLNLKGPRLQDLLTKIVKDGTSQENAINLEGVGANVIDVDTESEDDGPEVLPFYEPPKIVQLDRSGVWDEPQAVCQATFIKPPTTMTMAGKGNDGDSEFRKVDIIPETQVHGPNEVEVKEHEVASPRAESTTEATDDFDSEDDDGFDYDRELFASDDLEYYPRSIPPNTEIPTSSKPEVTFQADNGKSHHPTLTPPFHEVRTTRLGHVEVSSDAIDVSQHSKSTPVWAQRAPSPSDAALARKASDSKMSFSRGLFNKYHEPKWPATANTSHSYPLEHAVDISSIREEHFEPFSWPELQSPEPRLYDQGPFSSQPKVVVPIPHRSPKPDNLDSQPKKSTVTWADPCEDNDNFVMNTDRLGRTGTQASKITIPSLVENYLAENPRSFERKYGDTSGRTDAEAVSKVPRPDSPVTPMTRKRTFEEANPVVSSTPFEEGVLLKDNATQRYITPGGQDTPLPDAQPREDIFQTHSALMSQDSVARHTFDSASITPSSQCHDAEGPARKKARTSSSPSGGVGKFVMGVGFGLLGAAAAFVATIPTSVYEEALREFGNAA